MNLRYASLATLAVEHAFFGNGDAAFSWLLTDAVQAHARKRRVLLKAVGQQLHIANERDESDTPFLPVQDAVLRFGLQWSHRHLDILTASAINRPNLPLFHNASNPNQLAAAEPVRLSGPALRHVLRHSDRPLQVELRDAADQILIPALVANSDDVEEISFSHYALPEGRYVVVETADDMSEQRTQYVVDSSLLRATPDVVFELHLADDMVANPVELVASFAAINASLKYYLVLKNFSNAQQAELNIVDQGAADDGRPSLSFNKLQSDAFTADDLPPDSLIKGDENVILFKSDTSPPRQAAVRHKLQLRRNAEVVIPHLPHAGLDQRNTDVIVYLANP